jgi:hypothetical protein
MAGSRLCKFFSVALASPAAVTVAAYASGESVRRDFHALGALALRHR